MMQYGEPLCLGVTGHDLNDFVGRLAGAGRQAAAGRGDRVPGAAGRALEVVSQSGCVTASGWVYGVRVPNGGSEVTNSSRTFGWFVNCRRAYEVEVRDTRHTGETIFSSSSTRECLASVSIGP